MMVGGHYIIGRVKMRAREVNVQIYISMIPVHTAAQIVY